MGPWRLCIQAIILNRNAIAMTTAPVGAMISTSSTLMAVDCQ